MVLELFAKSRCISEITNFHDRYQKSFIDTINIKYNKNYVLYNFIFQLFVINRKDYLITYHATRYRYSIFFYITLKKKHIYDSYIFSEVENIE